MRLELNLNQYYENLNISQVNRIYSKFIDMKYHVEYMRTLLETPEEKRNKISWNVHRRGMLKICQEINDIMIEYGKPSIFDIKGLDDTDYQAIIKRHEYLMAGPQKGEEKKHETHDEPE